MEGLLFGRICWRCQGLGFWFLLFQSGVSVFKFNS
ncbi:hypothetical protein AAZX31_19G214800 [Glycine max]